MKFVMHVCMYSLVKSTWCSDGGALTNGIL